MLKSITPSCLQANASFSSWMDMSWIAHPSSMHLLIFSCVSFLIFSPVSQNIWLYVAVALKYEDNIPICSCITRHVLWHIKQNYWNFTQEYWNYIHEKCSICKNNIKMLTTFILGYRLNVLDQVLDTFIMSP